MRSTPTSSKAAKSTSGSTPHRTDYRVGRKGRDYFRKRIGDRLVGSQADMGGIVKPAITNAVADELLALFTSRRARQIDILSPHYISAVSNRPTISRYLPLQASSLGGGEKSANVDYILEPSPARALEAFLPRYLQSLIYLTLAETFTSEHSSRMFAMNNATRNCDDLTENLSLRANKARQAAITKEIAEIVGAAALG